LPSRAPSAAGVFDDVLEDVERSTSGSPPWNSMVIEGEVDWSARSTHFVRDLGRHVGVHGVHVGARARMAIHARLVAAQRDDEHVEVRPAIEVHAPVLEASTRSLGVVVRTEEVSLAQRRPGARGGSERAGDERAEVLRGQHRPVALEVRDDDAIAAGQLAEPEVRGL
jgi:hypothetical protein